MTALDSSGAPVKCRFYIGHIRPIPHSLIDCRRTGAMALVCGEPPAGQMENEMAEDKRRYFVAEGPEADQLRAQVLAALNKQRAEQTALAEKYGADQVFQWNDGRIAGLVYAAGEEQPTVPDGLAFDQRQAKKDGGFWYVFKPSKRGKAGKAIAVDLASVKGYRGSDEIVQHFKAYRGQAVGSAASRTGMAYAVSVAGIIKDTIVLSVPDVEDEPFDAPECLREIKKSEYIALTEE